MTGTTRPRSFADTIFARLISLAIAVAIGVVFYVYWWDDMNALYRGDSPEIPIVSQAQPDEQVNAALQNCLDRRVGDVDNMKAEGVINDAQYAAFRDRAVSFCRSRHAE